MYRLLVLVGAVCCVVLAGRAETGEKVKEEREYIRVEVKGILRTGVVAIGGETTGVTITARGATWEVDFGKNKDLRESAEKLNGRSVILTGTLEARKGVEIRQRWIVAATGLKAV